MHVFKLKNNRLNNRDINIDQNNRDYDFSHNRAALIVTVHWHGAEMDYAGGGDAGMSEENCVKKG